MQADGRYDVREERRSRKQLSCAECHRLKLKCDRQVPCANCVRRECADLCPNSVRVKKSRSEAEGSVVAELRDRLAAIEGLLSSLSGSGLDRRSRSRSRSPPRRGERDWSLDREREREREWERERDRGRDKEREREREQGRNRDREREHERERERDREQRERVEPHNRSYGDVHSPRQSGLDERREWDNAAASGQDRAGRRRQGSGHSPQDPAPYRAYASPQQLQQLRPQHAVAHPQSQSPYDPLGRQPRSPYTAHEGGVGEYPDARNLQAGPSNRQAHGRGPNGSSSTPILPGPHADLRATHPAHRTQSPLHTPSQQAQTPSDADDTRDRVRFAYDEDHRELQRTEGFRNESDESYGTLVLDKSGRSKWLGPTAGTEWLKNQELADANPSRGRSRSPSTRGDSPDPNGAFGFEQQSLFPFPSWGPAPTMETIMFHLPPPDEAAVLFDSYYQNYAWNHDVAPRRFVQPLFDRAYGLDEPASDEAPLPLARRVHPQQLALLFMIMAMGALHNPALPPHDPSAEHYLAAARWCLVRGDFLGTNTIAGLQTVVIMAHYHLETEKGRNGDSAWPLWGIAMRFVTAMGLHRDGERWNLPSEVVEERRSVFWECHTIDIFQANCFSRPSALRPEHVDTLFPSQDRVDVPNGLKTFATLKFELCRISGAILDQAMDVRPTPYSAIETLYDRMCAFERQIPFHLRCRTALLALPSVYADAESATRDSPDVDQHNLQRTFQQFTLALNISETIMFLQRPYFVKALQEAPQDPTRSMYGKSYLAMVERCNVLIEVVARLYELFPTVTARHWFFWYHLFTAAVCIGTMIIKNSSNPLAGFALGQIDHSIKLYSAVLRDHATPSLVQNHQWLLRLRARALNQLEHAPPVPEDEDIDVELLGWRTRFIERARGRHRATTIARNPASTGPTSTSGPTPMPPRTPSDAVRADTTDHPSAKSIPPEPIVAPAPSLDQVLQQHFVPPEQVPDTGIDMTTDLFLHQFWDPTTLLESRDGSNVPSLTTANWWNWDTDLQLGDQGFMPVQDVHDQNGQNVQNAGVQSMGRVGMGL